MVIPTPEPVRVDSPHITNDPAENQWPTIYDDNGDLFPKPSAFQEAPLLAARVAAGELPPVEERLPENPLVSEAHKTASASTAEPGSVALPALPTVKTWSARSTTISCSSTSPDQ